MKDEQTRLLLAVALSAILLIVWQKFFLPKAAPGRADAGALTSAVVDGGGTETAALPAAATDGGTGAAMAAGAPPAPEAAKAPEELVEFDSPQRHLTFTSHGGVLKSAVLKGEQFKRKVNGQDVQVDLVQIRPGQDALPFSLSFSGGLPPLPGDLPYAVEKTAEGVTFTGKVGDLTVVKRYTVPAEGYDVALEVSVRNASGAPASGQLHTRIDTYVPPGKEESGGFFGSRGPTEAHLPIARVEEKTDRRTADKDKGPETLTGKVQFAGLDEHYFLAAIYPVGASKGSVTLSSPADGARWADVALDATLPAGGELKQTYGIFLGPKLQETLQAAGATLPQLKAAQPELQTSVDYGMVAVISTLLLKVMRFFHSMIPNWGISIILLTLTVKAVLFPLTNKQMASMEAMRALQPRIEAIRTKFPDDKERQNLETMKLYQEAKVNPLGGCLPMLVQMPVWWGLYRTLEYAFDLYRQPFIGGWINDLSMMDPTYVLPIAMGASMFITQKMQPQMGDPQQAKIMLYFMPVFFTFIMKSLPAGLNLYILFNNILSVLQQMYLRRRYPGATPPAAGRTVTTQS